MPSNFTENYNLSQWERTDQVRMEDFNADNAKIDAALKAEADARTAADSAINAMLAKCGNCQLWSTSYVGTGTYGADNPTDITFPWMPVVAVIIGGQGEMMPLIPGEQNTAFHAGSGCGIHLTWNGKRVSWWEGAPQYQMNLEGRRYYVFALRTLN